MTTEERIAVLAGVSAFADQTPDALARLADELDELSVAPGTVLARERRPSVGESYVVVSGEAVLTLAGARQGTVGPGSFVSANGHSGDGTPATVTAVTLMHLLVVRSGDG
jgi:hypothetical protein